MPHETLRIQVQLFDLRPKVITQLIRVCFISVPLLTAEI